MAVKDRDKHLLNQSFHHGGASSVRSQGGPYICMQAHNSPVTSMLCIKIEMEDVKSFH